MSKDLDYIISKCDIMRLLEYFKFEEIANDNGVIRACCKIHGGDNPKGFVINEESTLYYCHTGCKKGGDVFTLVQEMLNIPFMEAVQWVSAFFNIDLADVKIEERKSKYMKDVQKFISIMKRSKVKKIEEYKLEGEFKDISKFRQFKEDTIEKFGIKYAESIKITDRTGRELNVKKKLVFPIIFREKLVGCALRRTQKTDKIKWLNQPLHVETGSMLYNYDEASMHEIFAVVEGITDVLAFHEIGIPAVATFSSNLTEEQYKLIMKTGSDVILAYDGDFAGREAMKKAIKMLKNKCNIQIIWFKEGEDPESIGRKELLKRYESRQRV